jgi:hypothetical protein
MHGFVYQEDDGVRKESELLRVEFRENEDSDVLSVHAFTHEVDANTPFGGIRTPRTKLKLKHLIF